MILHFDRRKIMKTTRYAGLLLTLSFALFASASPVGAQSKDLFNNFNPAGTANGPRTPTFFSLQGEARITQLVTYHWNAGRGSRPGFIGIRDLRGNSLGSFPATGVAGQGGAPNVNWVADVDIRLP